MLSSGGCTLDAVSCPDGMSFPDGVPGHISQICEDSRLEALLTDDVGNLSVCFQRVRVTGEDISGVNCLSDLVVSYRTCGRKVAV